MRRFNFCIRETFKDIHNFTLKFFLPMFCVNRVQAYQRSVLIIIRSNATSTDEN